MYQIGKKLVDDGIWREYSGARLKIGRAGSVLFIKAQDKLERPYRKKIERGTLPAATKRDINVTALSEAILLDWEGVADATGSEVDYTPELGKEALLNDPDLLEFVMDTALDNSNFAIEEENAIAKKSQSSKAG